jgi:hypothetical protein
VVRGDWRGPFDGRVVDAASGQAITGALVFASWGFELGRGLVAPAGAVTATVETDADGSYEVPRLATWPGRARAAKFTLIIYKNGYVAYRSDRRFEDLSERHDFVQRGNVARLERFPSGQSHARHVLFVGGGGALKRALAGEAVQASLETAVPLRAAPAAAGPPLDATTLLSEDELRAATGYQGAFSVGRLGDLPQSPTYDSKHFRAEGKPESFDAAIRVWKLGGGAAERYEALLKEVPHAEARNELGDRSLRGWDGRILAAAALDEAHGIVVELTCGVDLCRDAAQAVGLLRRVLSRAERLGGAPAEETHPEEKPPEEKRPEEKRPEEAPEAPPAEEQPFRLRPPELHR